MVPIRSTPRFCPCGLKDNASQIFLLFSTILIQLAYSTAPQTSVIVQKDSKHEQDTLCDEWP